MLKTERNTKTMGARVLRAFKKSHLSRRDPVQGEPRRKSGPRRSTDGHGYIRDYSVKRLVSADFEHGQWWITDLDTAEQWSVCDAEGKEVNGVIDGFCFEQVARETNKTHQVGTAPPVSR